MKALPMFIVLASYVLVSCTQRSSENTGANYADTIFNNGAVYTMDANRSWATAVAVQGEKIVYVGFDDGISSLKGPHTRVIDLGGKMLMPSFQDSHIHPISAGREALTVDLNALSSIEEYVSAIRTYAEANPDKAWILGGGWSMDVFGPGARTNVIITGCPGGNLDRRAAGQRIVTGSFVPQ